MLTNADMVELAALRHDLHRAPELSGQEYRTAETIAQICRDAGAVVVTGLGGTGVAAIFGAGPGPTTLLRAELDALPITEEPRPHGSQTPGVAHLCGHDGHMAILCGVARLLGRVPPAQGRAVLLFQPAEETGQGAAAVIADPGFAAITPDIALSLHNMPGIPLGQAGLRTGPVACASRGVRIAMTGHTSHASQPEQGLSPAAALAGLVPGLQSLASGTDLDDPDFRLVTVTHLRVGEPAFGISPGEGELLATLRTLRDRAMDGLCATVEALAAEAATGGLRLDLGYHEVFAHCENDPRATAILARAAGVAGLEITETGVPMRPSEDFGRFAAICPSAMLFLGAGRDHPALHRPDYDFPDALIAPGVSLFHAAIRELNG